MRTVSFFGWSGSAISVGAIESEIADLSLGNLAAVEKGTGIRPADRSRGFL